MLDARRRTQDGENTVGIAKWSKHILDLQLYYGAKNYAQIKVRAKKYLAKYSLRNWKYSTWSSVLVSDEQHKYAGSPTYRIRGH
jgi:hypothetical protein